jgi:hypothetical protein
MTTPENYPLIVAVMQVPKRTKREREQITMLLAPHTTFEDVTECLLGEPMNILEIMSLSGTDSRKTRHELELSHDRLAYAMHVASYLENIAKDLRNIEPISEHNLYSLGVILQRLPRVVTEESWFSYTSEREYSSESYEDFIFPSSTWIWDKLTQDYSIEGSYLPSNGNFTLLDLMNLWVRERGVQEMGESLNLKNFHLYIRKGGQWL